MAKGGVLIQSSEMRFELSKMQVRHLKPLSKILTAVGRPCLLLPTCVLNPPNTTALFRSQPKVATIDSERVLGMLL